MLAVKFSSLSHLLVVETWYQFVHDVLKCFVRPIQKTMISTTVVNNISSRANILYKNVLNIRFSGVEQMLAGRALGILVQVLQYTTSTNCKEKETISLMITKK